MSIPQFHPARPGDWVLFCDVCGMKIYGSESVVRWDNLVVCLSDNDLPPPTRYSKTVIEDRSVPHARPSQDAPISSTPSAPDPLNEGWYNPDTPSM